MADWNMVAYNNFYNALKSGQPVSHVQSNAQTYEGGKYLPYFQNALNKWRSEQPRSTPSAPAAPAAPSPVAPTPQPARSFSAPQKRPETTFNPQKIELSYDPDKDVYAMPTDFQAPESGESILNPDKATVEGRVKSMVTSGSPLLETAKKDAQRTLGKRGLLNSTMAGTAGEKALLDKAIEIAEPDAALYGDMAKAEHNATLQGALNKQSFSNAGKIAVLQGEIAKNFQEFSFQFQEKLTKMGLESAERIAINSAMSAQTQTLMSNIGSLLNNPDIEMGDNVHSWMSDFMYKGWEGMASLFDLNIQVV